MQNTQHTAQTTTGVWVAGYNMPGYLPESDPVAFESFEDAKQYMIDTLDRHGDVVFDGGDSMRHADPEEAQKLLDEADELSAAMEDLNLVIGHTPALASDGWGIIVGNTSYWITYDASQTLADFEDGE